MAYGDSASPLTVGDLFERDLSEKLKLPGSYLDHIAESLGATFGASRWSGLAAATSADSEEAMRGSDIGPPAPPSVGDFTDYLADVEFDDTPQRLLEATERVAAPRWWALIGTWVAVIVAVVALVIGTWAGASTCRHRQAGHWAFTG